MALSAGERQIVANTVMRDNENPYGAFTKAELRTAINATDQWIDDNQASWVATLPAAVASGTTAAQKAQIFAYVLMRRFGNLRAEED